MINEAPELDLVGRVVMANYNAYAATAGSLIDTYRRQLAEREAELAVIREAVSALLAGPYAPSAAAIERAVFLPDRIRIAALVAEEENPSA